MVAIAYRERAKGWQRQEELHEFGSAGPLRARTIVDSAPDLVTERHLDQAGGVKQCLGLESSVGVPGPRQPALAPPRADFLTVMSWRSKNRQTAVRLLEIRRFNAITTFQCDAGRSATRASSHSACFSRGEVLPPLGFALALPVRRQRCNHRTAEPAPRVNVYVLAGFAVDHPISPPVRPISF
jgi:hypothetical protein